jgi:hypothetical protein
MSFFLIFWFAAMVWVVYNGSKTIIKRKTYLYYRVFFNGGRIDIEGNSAVVLGIIEIIMAIVASIMVFRYF